MSAFRASVRVKSSFRSFFPPSSLNRDCYLLSLLDSSGQVACRGAGCQQTADIGGEEDAVQDLPGGVPQEHQGNQGWAGQGLFIFCKMFTCRGLFSIHIAMHCCWLSKLLCGELKQNVAMSGRSRFSKAKQFQVILDRECETWIWISNLIANYLDYCRCIWDAQSTFCYTGSKMLAFRTTPV